MPAGARGHDPRNQLHQHRLRLAAVNHWCLNTLAPPNVVQAAILGILGGVTQYAAPFIADDSDTGRHLDHITVQVAKDRARYAFDASLDNMQNDRTLGLTRVPIRRRQVATALLGTLVHYSAASLRAESAKMFWEIAGAQGTCPGVHYPVPEFTSLLGGNWINRIPQAVAALDVGLYNPIECPRGADFQLQSPPGIVITLRTAKLRHCITCRLTLPYAMPWRGHHGPTTPSRTTTISGQQPCRTASTNAPTTTSTTANANRGQPTTSAGTTPWSTCPTPSARGTPA